MKLISALTILCASLCRRSFPTCSLRTKRGAALSLSGDHFDPDSAFLLSCKQDDTLMLTGVERGGKDESMNAWEMDERAQARNAQEEANNCGVWMECEEYGLGLHAE